MGRFEVPMAKKENTTMRHLTFAKRRLGLLKRTYELSALCDIDCALIMFSPSGWLTHFSKRRIEDVLIKFLSIPNQETCFNISRKLPNREDLMALLENLKTEDMAGQTSSQKRSSSSNLSEGRWDSQDIYEEVVKSQNQLESLNRLLRFCFQDLSKMPIVELKERETKLLELLDQVTTRKNYLLGTSATSAASFLPVTVQHKEGTSIPLEQKLESLLLTEKRKIPMQPPHEEKEGATGIKEEKERDLNNHSLNTVNSKVHSIESASLPVELSKLNF